MRDFLEYVVAGVIVAAALIFAAVSIGALAGIIWRTASWVAG